MDSPELRSAGFEVIDSPSCISTPRLNLGEFEEDASPLESTFCRNLTQEEYDNVGASETEKALQALIEHMESNPAVLMKILQRRKQDEIENSGIMSMLKSRMMLRLQGDKYKKKLVTQSECDSKMSELSQGMVMVFNYAQVAKGRRFSKRLASKRLASQTDLDTTPLKRPLEDRPKCRIPVPPPLPPPLTGAGCMGNGKAQPPPPPPPPVPPPKLSPMKKSKSAINSPTVGDLKRPPIRNSSAGSLVSVHEELLSSNPLQKLRPTKHQRSPGGTPLRKTRSKMNTSIDSVDMSTPFGLRNQEPLATALFRVLEEKFKNIRSPSPAPSASNLTVFSPGDFSP